MNEERLLEIFSKNLRELMKENNINQKDLAYETGIDQSRISRYMAGKSMPSFFTVVKLSEVLFCSLDDFVTEP